LQPHEGVAQPFVFRIDDPGFVKEGTVLEALVLVRVGLQVERLAFGDVAAPGDAAPDAAPAVILGQRG
jgi:hypothetical protein